MEQLDYNLLFRWFVGINMDDPIWDVTAFTEDRERLLEGDIAPHLVGQEGAGVGGLLCSQGHIRMENRHGLGVATQITLATGTAEREAALWMATSHPGRDRLTLAEDKAYDTAPFVRTCRTFHITPRVAQRRAGSAIDSR